MEVIVPTAPAKNFHADKSTAGSTPYVSAPSSPRAGFDYLYHYYTSAPSSPTRITAIYSSIPFQCDDKPDPSNDADLDHMGNNNNNNNNNNDDDEDDHDFEFNFSGQLQKVTAADELFEAGKIRTLKLQPRSQPNQSRRGAAGEDVLVRRGRSAGPSSANSSRARSLSPDLRGGNIGVGKEGSSRN